MYHRRIAITFALALLAGCDDGNSGKDDTEAAPATSSASNSSDESSGNDSSGNDTARETTADETTGDPGDGTDGGMDAECAGGPLAAPIAGCAPPAPAATDDPHQDCVGRINQLRWECQCLPPLLRWTEAETCTDDQSGADQSGGGAHANFGVCNEYGQNTCPNWGSDTQVIDGCLQSMWDEGPGEPFAAHGHYINMTNPDYTKVACGFASGADGVWSNQNFSG